MTGLMYIVVTPDGERTIVGHRGANALTDPNEINAEEIQGARLFLLSGYALLAGPQRSAALLALEQARRHGLTVALDPGMSGARAAVDDIRSRLAAVDILLPNLAEAQQLTGLTAPEDCAQALLDTGLQVVAVKLGKEGCLIASGDGVFRVPGLAVEARDSTGAGDSFAAGLIGGYLRGLAWPSAAVLGNALGALAAARVGSGAGTLKATEVLALLGDHAEQPAYRPWQGAIRRVMDFVTALQ
jgi:sugar/nucleoside kinase (ribokinase family)